MAFAVKDWRNRGHSATPQIDSAFWERCSKICIMCEHTTNPNAILCTRKRSQGGLMSVKMMWVICYSFHRHLIFLTLREREREREGKPYIWTVSGRIFKLEDLCQRASVLAKFALILNFLLNLLPYLYLTCTALAWFIDLWTPVKLFRAVRSECVQESNWATMRMKSFKCVAEILVGMTLLQDLRRLQEIKWRMSCISSQPLIPDMTAS